MCDTRKTVHRSRNPCSTSISFEKRFIAITPKISTSRSTHINDIHLYYELIKLFVIANAHCIHLILNVPLRSADRHYTLFRIITLTIRVTSDKFIQYSVDYTYFGIQHNEQNYLLFTEASFIRCNKGSIDTCKADIADFDSQTNTCESSLFLRQKVLTNCVEGNYLYITIPHLYNDIVPYGSISLRSNNE